jgi:hypothetical protein
MCAQSNDKPYLDPALSVEQRVADLLSRMTWEEKVDQLGSYTSSAHGKIGLHSAV